MLLRRVLLVLVLIVLGGCATKFRFPLNRMITPESVGGAFNSEFDIGKVGQAEGKVDISSSSPFPINTEQVDGMSYFGALSFTESIDFYWNHTADAPSIVGGRYQFLGGSQQAGGAGHSMAVTLGFGGNEHESEDSPKVEFAISASDLSLVHGYWFTPFWQIFETLAYTTYGVEGKIGGAGGGKIQERLKQTTAAVGTALVFKPMKVKFEASYSQLDWSDSKDRTYVSYAMALGFNF